jgi:hypothetical protein
LEESERSINLPDCKGEHRNRTDLLGSAVGVAILRADMIRALQNEAMTLLEIGVFGPGLLQNWNVRVRISAERHEI